MLRFIVGSINLEYMNFLVDYNKTSARANQTNWGTQRKLIQRVDYPFELPNAYIEIEYLRQALIAADICERKTKNLVFKVNFIKLSWEATQKIIDKMRMDIHYAKIR